MKKLFLFLATIANAGPYDEGIKALREARFEEARAYLEQAVATDDRPEDALWELGWAHWTLEDYEGANVDDVLLRLLQRLRVLDEAPDVRSAT